jgi:hypothetical protein
MNFKNEFVTHGKIHVFYFATIKKHCSKGNIIDFGSAKNTIVKRAINKSNRHKQTLREITMVENATFKFL